MKSWEKGISIEKVKKMKLAWLQLLTPVEFETYMNSDWKIVAPNPEPVIEDKNITTLEPPKNKFSNKIFIGY